MRRRLLPAVYALAMAACTPTYQPADIGASDAESRYPIAVSETRDGFARLAAVALVLYVGWLVADRLWRRRERRIGAIVSAGVFVALLVTAAVVVQTAGPYPQGIVYRTAVDGSFVLPWVMVLGGVGWLIERETDWGLFHVLGGLVLWVFALIAGFPVWDCC